MTAPAPTPRAGYLAASRAPRYSILFVLPLLVAYEVLAALEPATRTGSIRNGADVILESAFTALAGRWGPLAFLATLIGIGVWLVIRDRRNGTVRPALFAVMLLEAAVLAVLFGLGVGAVTSQLVRPPMAIGALAQGIESLPLHTQVVVALGAGIYEELLFRVVLVSGLAWFFQRVLGFGSVSSDAGAVLLGALIFSAFHYIGPYGEPLALYSFIFRTVAGLFFSAIYVVRGFGIVAWTHSLYDLFLLLY
ncbi:MAG TPA: CPBP family intramembrane glutamic endopeptidase [Gemmatimonadales bacterium]|nr:CPBP family intramembrane glutamic endopeptidase [Gemmatimonadales bacterium]